MHLPKFIKNIYSTNITTTTKFKALFSILLMLLFGSDFDLKNRNFENIYPYLK